MCSQGAGSYGGDVDTEPRRVLLAGDTHGNGRWVGHLCKLARTHSCEVIVQLGDFGFWPHTADGLRLLAEVEWHAQRNGVARLVWIDGNHENHDALGELEPETDGTVDIGSRCAYLPRGHRWEWRGFRFGALGGAFSIDWRHRVLGESWWPQEVLTAADVDRLGDERLDVLVCHDAPAGVPLRGLALPPADEVRASEVRDLIAEAVRRTQPRLVVHGHWHHRYSFELTWPIADDAAGLAWASTQVEGLAADVQASHQAWAILDLDPFAFIGSSTLHPG